MIKGNNEPAWKESFRNLQELCQSAGREDQKERKEKSSNMLNGLARNASDSKSSED